MRFVAVATAWILGAWIVGASAAWGQAPAVRRLEGTLVRVVPQQGIVVRTADKKEVPVALSAQSRIRVFTQIEMAKLPAEVTCYVNSASLGLTGKDLKVASITLVEPGSAAAADSFITLTAGGGVNFERTLGKFKRGPPMTFQVGPAFYQVTGPGGINLAAPQGQQNVLLGRVYPVTSTGTQLRARLEFGSDLSRAGVDAKVDVRFGGGPNQADTTQVDVERVEPLPPVTPPK
jgi:hypothetical protein